jgi:hypothetical protein
MKTVKPTYSKKDYAHIATAIGKKVADVERQEKAFAAASLWYRLDSKAPAGKRVTPFRMQNRMTRIASAADRLLKQLGVCDAADAPDGPAIGILEVLASTGNDTEDTVIRATARIGRLVELLEAVDATRELKDLALRGSASAKRIGRLIVPKGHQGDVAENNWIAAMMSLYRQITGKEPRTSVGGLFGNDEGKARGPLIRFLEAAGKPIGIKYSTNGWRSRIRVVQKGTRSK